jgi:hypothetical protein
VSAIGVRLRDGDLQRALQAIDQFGKQGRFALAQTLNDLARQTRDAIRADLPTDLTIRTAQAEAYLRRSVQAPRELAARKDSLSAAVVLDRLNKRGMLPSLSEGGENESGPWGPVAVPTQALRPSKASVIPRSLYPRALKLVNAAPAILTRKGRGKKSQRLGAFRTTTGTVQVFGKARTWATPAGVYQRTGPGPHDIRKLWTYVDHAEIPRRVPYHEIAQDVADKWFGTLFERRLAAALATAR